MNLSDLSCEALTQLYSVEKLSDTEIAKRYGTYQAKVSRLRAQYGIPTLKKSDRLELPDLTARQRAILVGSMLGDGRLFKTGTTTAAFSEYHSLEQEAYLRWKASEWGSYLKSIRSTTKEKDGKTYRGLILRTHGCSQLWSYWKRFYPQGSGSKSFVGALGRLTALALAVWYMDDGSKTWHGYVRLAVTPNQEDQALQMDLLRDLGLNPRYHENSDGSDPSIWIHDRTSISKFLDLVTPHVPECMSYKLDLKPRSRGDAPRHLLTKELLATFVSQGWGASRIAKSMKVSVNSVRSALDRHGMARPKAGRPPDLDTAVSWSDAKTLIASTELSEEDLVKLLVRLPPQEEVSMDKATRDWAAIQQAKVALEGIRPGNQGQALCRHFFPYRLDSRYESLPSVNRAWFDPTWVTKAVRFQKSVGDPLLPLNVHRALRAILRAPTNFRPALAKAIVEAYCPEGGLVLDPCAGYGGRVVGTLAANRRYHGVDPHPLAGEAYARLSRLIGPFGFENCPYEDAELDLEADLVFTSPPYYSKERYSDDPSQSWVRYPTWDSWVSGFLAPFVAKSWGALKPGGAFIVNTKDIKMNRRVYPIVQEVLRLAEIQGFKLEDQRSISLGYLGKSESLEPLLIFRKSA